MASWQGKSRGNVLGYKIFFFVLNRTGLAPAYLLLRFVAFYYFLFDRSGFRPSFRYFRSIHGYPYWTSIFSVYRNFYVFGQTIIDKVALMSGVKTPFTFHFDGEENLHQMAGSTGGILLSAHIGNWEIAGQLLNRLNTRFNLVMYDHEHQNIKQYLGEVMKNKDVNIIVIRNDMSHIFAIKEALDNKELICIHGDRYVSGSKALPARLMGRKAYFPAGPFQIASKFKVPYSFVFAAKEGHYHYHLFATPGKVHNGNIQELVDQYTNALEEKIKRYPEQWFNFYDFWVPEDEEKKEKVVAPGMKEV